MGKLFGGVLLIAGTCIGGGMLGLPIATAQGGIVGSLFLFTGCWILMTFTALLTLEVNLCFPQGSNILSMAKATLGKPAEIICWTVYLLFLYALVAAYIAGGQDVLHGILKPLGLHLPLWVCSILFVCLFGAVVMAGIKQVDLFNRVLMVIKLSSIFILMGLIATHINVENYAPSRVQYLLPALTVAITSFGFSIIVPSLRNYFNDDIQQLRLAILLGSFLPLICYIAWNAVIFGLIPLEGEYGLAPLLNAKQPVTGLLTAISYYIPAHVITLLSRLFSSICVLTAFACVSLGLFDYLADAIKQTKFNTSQVLLGVLTFLPPTLVVMFYPRAFILFLSLAGICCVFLQALLPALMAWQCRYIKSMSSTYEVYGGKTTLSLSILISCLVIIIALYQFI